MPKLANDRNGWYEGGLSQKISEEDVTKKGATYGIRTRQAGKGNGMAFEDGT